MTPGSTEPNFSWDFEPPRDEGAHATPTPPPPPTSLAAPTAVPVAVPATDPVAPPARHRRRRLVIGMILAALVVAAGVLGGLALTSDGGEADEPAGEPSEARTDFDPKPTDPLDDLGELGADAGLGDPRTMELPEPEEPDATAEFLSGDGGPLAESLAVLAALADEEVDCEEVAADLDDLATPTEYLALTGEVPDPVTAGLLQNLQGAAGSRMALCEDSGDEVDSARAELAFHWTLVAQRFDELEVER